MRVFDERQGTKRIGLLKEIPTSVVHYPNRAPKWGSISHKGIKDDLPSGCLHCKKPKCMQFRLSQIASDIVAFAFDRNTNVCPVEALKWDTINNEPIIDQRRCIKCGLCAKMCPLGAIFYNGEAFTVCHSPLVEMVPDTVAYSRMQENQLEQVSDIFHIGYIIKENDTVLEKIYSRMQRLRGNTPNLIARNLLIALGNKCAIGRVGDVYTRLDALLETPNGEHGVVEVEFGRDTLDASRGILDDIAVANCRYGIRKNDNHALVICLRLPNERQGYWQVIKDIKKVENIEINTVTVGALLLLMWSFQDFNMEKDSFYADFDDMSIRKKVDYILDSDTTVNVSYRKLGILEPEK